VLNARITPYLGETDHVVHAPAVLVRQESVRARRDALERLVALADGRLRLERTEVYAHPAQGLEGRPRPLVGSLGDHILIAERPAALRARSHELEGVSRNPRVVRKPAGAVSRAWRHPGLSDKHCRVGGALRQKKSSQGIQDRYRVALSGPSFTCPSP